MRRLNICLITRYPPIPGGTSSASYWTAKKLGESGHKIHVVTDSLERKGLKGADPKTKQYKERLRELIKNPEHAKEIGLDARKFYITQACPEKILEDFQKCTMPWFK